MATKKISELTEKTSLSGSEEFIINDGGTSKKVTADNIGGGGAWTKVSETEITTATNSFTLNKSDYSDYRVLKIYFQNFDRQYTNLYDSLGVIWLHGSTEYTDVYFFSHDSSSAYWTTNQNAISWNNYTSTIGQAEITWYLDNTRGHIKCESVVYIGTAGKNTTNPSKIQNELIGSNVDSDSASNPFTGFKFQMSGSRNIDGGTILIYGLA